MTAAPTLDRPPRIAPPPSAPEAVRTSHRSSGLGWIFTAFFGVFGWAIGAGEAERQLVLLAPAYGRVHPRSRHPAPRRLLVHRAGHQVGRAVVARRGDLRGAFSQHGRLRRPAVRRPRRRRHRHADVPARAAHRARSPRRVRAHRRRARGDLHRVVGTTAAHRRALPARAALDRRGPRQHRRPAPAGRRARADVAVGQHPRHVPARLRLPRPAPARTLDRRRPAMGRSRTDACCSAR